MAKLIYTAIQSLDGYIEDDQGKFDWAEPDAEVHALANDLERPVGTFLYGRRLYEVMVFWETVDLADEPPVIRDYAEIWRAAEKIVYSNTLQTVSSEKTRIEREFDPAAVRALKEAAKDDLAVGGADLAATAFAEGLVDELHLIVVPVLVGGCKRSLPDGVRLDLELVDERRFGNGTVYLGYHSR